MPEHLWVIRAVRIEVLDPSPRATALSSHIVTWGSGLSALAPGAVVARGDAGGSIEVDSTWIHLGPDARPARIGEGFAGYAAATQEIAATRLTLVQPPSDGPRAARPLRTTDVDRMGHANNAADWAAVEQRLAKGRSMSAGRCVRVSTTAIRSTSARASSSLRQPTPIATARVRGR